MHSFLNYVFSKIHYVDKFKIQYNNIYVIAYHILNSDISSTYIVVGLPIQYYIVKFTYIDT